MVIEVGFPYRENFRIMDNTSAYLSPLMLVFPRYRIEASDAALIKWKSWIAVLDLVVYGLNISHKTSLTSSTSVIPCFYKSYISWRPQLSRKKVEKYNHCFFHITFCRYANTTVIQGDILLTSLLRFGPQLHRLLVFDILHAKSCHLGKLSLCHPLEQQ